MSEQAPVTTEERTTTTFRTFRYGGGALCGIMGLCLLLLSFFLSPAFLSDTTEWHLWSVHLPFIIPNVVMKAVWWLMAAGSAYALLIASLPSATIRLSDSELLIQNPLTRKFKTFRLSEILDVVFYDYGLTITDRQNQTAHVPKIYMESQDFSDLHHVLNSAVERHR